MRIVLPLVLALLAAGCAPPGPASAPAPRTGFVETEDSVRLAFRVEGSGRDTLIMLHGGPGLTGESLWPDLGPLARGRVVIYYDQRGSGYSTAVTGEKRISLRHHVADLEAVRRHFGLERMVVAGHSWGGGLAVRYALAHPDRVERLLLVDPLPPREEPYMDRFSASLRSWMDDSTRKRYQAAVSAENRAPDPAAACRATWAIFIRGYLAEPRDPSRLRGSACAGPPENLDNLVSFYTMLPLTGWDWRKAAREVRVPVLIVHGEADPLPVEGSREWAAAMPESRLLVVERSGHFPHVERPEVFFPAVEAFLRGGWPREAVRLAAP